MSIDHTLPHQGEAYHPTSKKQPSSASSTVVYATSRQSSSFSRGLRQLGVVCRLNVLLLIRYWKAAILQVIILPLLVVGIIYGVQKAYSSDNGKVIVGDSTVSTWTMPGIPQCKPEPLSNACMTIVYTPQNAETTQIMNYFQTQNQVRTNQELKIESTVWSDLSSVPKSNMGIVPVPSEKFIYDYALAHPDTIQLGVAFTKQEPVAPATAVHWNYQVYYNMTHATNITVKSGFKYTQEAGYNREGGFDDPYGAQLPNMIRAMDEALLTFLDPQHTQAQLDYSLKSFPTADRVNGYSSQDDMVNTMSNLMALPACITMIMAMLRVMREKESKCRESMEMMGLSSFTYWTAQWLTSWIMALIQGSVIVALGYAFKMQMIVNSSGFVMWAMFVLLAYAMTLLGFLLTTFCQKSGTALGFGFALLVAVLIVVPILASGLWPDLWLDTSFRDIDSVTGMAQPPDRRYTWILCFIFPFLNFARLWSQISTVALGHINYDSGEYTAGTGFNFSNLNSFSAPQAEWEGLVPLPASGLTYQLICIAVIALLTLYFDKVIADEYGRSSGVFFFLGSIGDFFRWIRYGGAEGVARFKSADAQKVIPYEGQPPADEDNDVVAERERAVNCQTDVAIRISNLTKTYTKNGPGFFKNLYLALCCCCCRTRRRSNKIENRAVDRLNLLTEPNELFALLGQNGAGKSTTMQMLYGVTTPTSGNAFLFNRSIKTDMHAIRSTMGVCPQHDVLFNDLTCWEHMQLYAGIKDLPTDALRADFDDSSAGTETVKENTRERHTWIRSRLEAVQLWKDRDTMAGRLSGGMKRRLSTIISTIGDPNVLILDEPTTGMDPVHRRHVWTFLAQFKRGRSILLTTHSMEEADALGDKVAIMVSGHLKAIGNTTRLKNKFGNGYRVELALGHPTEQYPDIPAQKELEQEMTEATKAVMPESVLLDKSGGVMVFGIPMQAIEKMADLTAMLENAQALGRVKQWGIAQTSLEEVFLSLIRSSDDRH
ncbi:P-loop containing nucleoside triphosphate hydrolase protein [Linnemannia elongata AG-77]|uniref:p-loop containing nucleoside triphosphate hydrolase protein n=1 Tax=Linnemannia elongata AG-77 TaxID=1314771 RepID=A0A197K516_9FUNG|nr:P-loop containing nucleoside triphosphate hydrolase protein [Linnemannia elongata AG-77]